MGATVLPSGVADAMLGQLPASLYAQAHTGDPGADGTANVAPGTQVRGLAQLLSASGGQRAWVGPVDVSGITPGTQVSHVSLWSATSDGLFRLAVQLDVPVSVPGIVRVTLGPVVLAGETSGLPQGAALVAGAGAVAVVGERVAEGVAAVEGAGDVAAAGGPPVAGGAVAVEGAGEAVAAGERVGSGTSLVEGAGDIATAGQVVASGTPPIYDNFDRANGAIADATHPWVQAPGYSAPGRIVSNKCTGSTSTYGSSYWSGADAPTGNVYVQAKTQISGDDVKLRVATTGTGATGYFFENVNSGGNKWTIDRWSNGTGGVVATATRPDATFWPYVRLELTDNGDGTITLRGYAKMLATDAWGDPKVTYTDTSPLADGKPGFGVNSSGTSGLIDDWEAGAL